MKRLLTAMMLMPLMALADVWKDPDIGIEWMHAVSGGAESVVVGSPR